MRIASYSFGRIVVDGTEYREDVVVTPSGVRCPWWRRRGHRLDPADLEDLEPPGVLVIGTGASGAMAVPPETVRILEARGFRVHVAPTARAVELFNRLAAAGRAFAALHLTC